MIKRSPTKPKSIEQQPLVISVRIDSLSAGLENIAYAHADQRLLSSSGLPEGFLPYAIIADFRAVPENNQWTLYEVQGVNSSGRDILSRVGSSTSEEEAKGQVHYLTVREVDLYFANNGQLRLGKFVLRENQRYHDLTLLSLRGFNST